MQSPKFVVPGGTATWSYDARGLIQRQEHANAALTTATYDPVGRALQIWHAKPDSTEIDHCFYAYDAAGRPLYKQTLDGYFTYLYDSVDQLVSENNPSSGLTTWTYDSGRRRTLQSSPQGVTTYILDAADQLLAAELGAAITTYGYDANGSQVSVQSAAGTATYGWDPANRLQTVTPPSGSVLTYLYRPDGLRVQRLRTAVDDEGNNLPAPQDTIWDGRDALAWRRDGPNMLFVRGPVLAREQGSSGPGVAGPPGPTRAVDRHYHLDGLGTVQALTDGTAAVLTRHLVDAWGNVLSGGVGHNPFVYLGNSGYWQDGDAGLDYVRARWLRTGTGSWLSIDPVPGEPRYAYARNAPTWLLDPSGAEAQSFQDRVRAFLKTLASAGGLVQVAPPQPQPTPPPARQAPSTANRNLVAVRPPEPRMIVASTPVQIGTPQRRPAPRFAPVRLQYRPQEFSSLVAVPPTPEQLAACDRDWAAMKAAFRSVQHSVANIEGAVEYAFRWASKGLADYVRQYHPPTPGDQIGLAYWKSMNGPLAFTPPDEGTPEYVEYWGGFSEGVLITLVETIAWPLLILDILDLMYFLEGRPAFWAGLKEYFQERWQRFVELVAHAQRLDAFARGQIAGIIATSFLLLVLLIALAIWTGGAALAGAGRAAAKGLQAILQAARAGLRVGRTAAAVGERVAGIGEAAGAAGRAGASAERAAAATRRIEGTAERLVQKAASAAAKAARGGAGPEDLLVRRGTSAESARRLAGQAAAAESAGAAQNGVPYGHGVSVTTPESNARLSRDPADAVSTTRRALEEAGFEVRHTPTRADPNHHTVQLPKPVTEAVADSFNRILGRK